MKMQRRKLGFEPLDFLLLRRNFLLQGREPFAYEIGDLKRVKLLPPKIVVVGVVVARIIVREIQYCISHGADQRVVLPPSHDHIAGVSQDAPRHLYFHLFNWWRHAGHPLRYLD
jgi:hypothetical protein